MADKKTASFIENVRTIANATKLSSSDIVEDTELSAERAVLAAQSAEASATLSSNSENKANEWAEKGYNNPVGFVDGEPEYSSYHWARVAKDDIEEGRLSVINDEAISNRYTWSSSKINTELGEKSNTDHTHAGEYEKYVPEQDRNTAYDKNFGTSIDTVAEGNHLHDGVYEPKRTYIGDVYDKDFGLDFNQVSRGNHTHDDDSNGRTAYEPKRSSQGSAYNKNWVQNSANPAHEEVPYGDHTHTALKTSLDSSNMDIVSSNDVQGGIQMLDDEISRVQFSEATYFTGVNVGENAIAVTPNTPVDSNVEWTTLNAKNASNIGDNKRITISYEDTPDRIVEGTLTATFSFVENEDMIVDVLLNGVTYGAGIKGSGSVTINRFLTGIDLRSEDATITFKFTNTEGTTIQVTGADVVWNGSPQGAVIASGSTFVHNESTGRDAVNSHPIGAITDLQTTLDDKALINGSSTQTFKVKADTDLSSAVNLEQLNTKLNPVTPTRDGAIAVLDIATGNIIDSNKLTSELADVNGSDQNKFSVKDGEIGNDAVNYSQLSSVGSVANNAIPKLLSPTDNSIAVWDNSTGNLLDSNTLTSSFASSSHSHDISDVTDENGTVQLSDILEDKYDVVSSPVEGNVPVFLGEKGLADSGSSLSDLAPAQHNHAISDVAGLQIELDDKYTKVVTPVTGNIPTFAANGELEDSGFDADGVYTSIDLAGSIGNINSPLLDLPLQNSLSMNKGVGSVTFTRATTATYVDRYGVLQYADVDEPRFEKDGLLIEGNGTNMLAYSEDSSHWGKNSVTSEVVTDTVNPYNVSSTAKINGTSDALEHFTENFVGITSGTNDYTVSVFVKKGTQDTILYSSYIIGGGSYFNTNMKFTFSTKTSDNPNCKIQELANGWFRLSMPIADDDTGNTTLINRVYVNDGAQIDTLGEYTYVFGFQAEKLPFASSYIPTTTSAVTRSSDMVTATNYNNTANDEFTISAKLKIGTSTLTYHTFAVVGNLAFYAHNTASGVLEYFNGANQEVTSISINDNTIYDITFVFSKTNNNSKVYVNGNIEYTGDYGAPDFIGKNNILLGSWGGSDTPSQWYLNGSMKSMKIYEQALSATEVNLLGGK